MEYTRLLSRRFVAFVLALIMLVTVLGLIQFMIRHRPAPQPKMTESTFIPEVRTLSLTRGTQPIHVRVNGVVKSEKRITLNAPYAGRVHAALDLVPGMTLTAGQNLFEMETTKLDLGIERLEEQLKSLKLERIQLEEDGRQLRNRLATAEVLVDTNQEQIAKAEEALRIQTSLYEKNKQLFEQRTISEAEFLRAEAAFVQAEDALLSIRNIMENNKERIHNVRQSIALNNFQLSNLAQRRRGFELQIGELKSDRGKSALSVDYATSVVEVFVDREQEVAPGTPLATLRSIDGVEVVVNLPDTHFNWLYNGPLLTQKDEGRTFDIHLVNSDYKKVFKGGVLKSVGSQLNEPTRSLPIIIERQNPVDANGVPIPEEELKPGMYCEVLLELDRVQDSFFIPLTALQREDRLYEVIFNAKDEPELNVITDGEILHETREGVIFRHSDNQVTSLTLVAHPVREAQDGMTVKMLSEEG